jgi:hypothetical protein
MPSRIDRFIADSRWERTHGPTYLPPTCPEVEVQFRDVFEAGKQRKSGIIFNRRGLVAAQVFRAEVTRADEWVEGAEAVTPNATVLINNPRGYPSEDFGSVNALVRSGGYLLVAKPRMGGLEVTRPVRGANRVGYHYQDNLRGMFDGVINGLPKNFTPPTW